MEPTPRPSRSFVPVLLAALVALNLYQVMRIAGLESRLDSLQGRVSQINGQMQSAVNNGVQQLARQLEEEASPLVESGISPVGLVPDQGDDGPLVQIDLSATPKEYTPNMRVQFLLMDEAGTAFLADGAKEEAGNRFSAQMTAPIGGVYTASVILTADGVETTVPIEMNLEPLQSCTLGVSAYSSGSTSTRQGGGLQMDRVVEAYAYDRGRAAEQPVQVTTARLLLRRNGAEEKSWALQDGDASPYTTRAIREGTVEQGRWSYHMNFQETLQVQVGDQIQLAVVLEDSRGFRYETVVDQFTWQGSGSAPEWADYGDTAVYYGDTFLGFTWG